MSPKYTIAAHQLLVWRNIADNLKQVEDLLVSCRIPIFPRHFAQRPLGSTLNGFHAMKLKRVSSIISLRILDIHSQFAIFLIGSCTNTVLTRLEFATFNGCDRWIPIMLRLTLRNS